MHEALPDDDAALVAVIVMSLSPDCRETPVHVKVSDVELNAPSDGVHDPDAAVVVFSHPTLEILLDESTADP